MTPWRSWFTQIEPGRWIPRSREAWVLTAAIVITGFLLGRVA